MSVPAALLAIPMGMGKTASVLHAVRRLLKAGTVRRVLIIAPLRVARDTWPDEIADWDCFADLDFAVATGTAAEREAALLSRKPITVINRENLQWLWKFLGGKPGWDWDMLVYDESSRLKGFTTRNIAKKTESGVKKKSNLTEFGVLAMVRPKIKRVVLLTGTPSPNGLHDLGGQAYMIDMGERLGSSKTAFLDRWFIQSKYDYGIKPMPFAEEQIMGRLSDVMFSLRAEDYIDLPKRQFIDRYVKLSPRHMQEYRAFERSLYSEVYDVEACSRGVLTNKLLQFANGSMYRMPEGVENPKREIVKIHDEKLYELESVIEEANGANVLIAYSFQFDLERIRKRYPKIVVFDETPDFKKRWNNGEIRMGIGHPASFSHGLNLQFGGHIQIWFGLTHSYEFYDQFNWRLARSGQPNPMGVQIYRIIARGTADEDVVESMHEKGVTQDSVTERVRVRILNAMKKAA